MRFNFWLELPITLISVFEQNASLEDIEKGKCLLNNSKAMEQIYSKIHKELDHIAIFRQLKMKTLRSYYKQ
jgi:hypothetical protein